MSSYREALVARSTAQRAALVAAAQPLLAQAAAADRVLARLHQYRYPLIAGAALIALIGSRKVFDLASRILTIYALFRR